MSKTCAINGFGRIGRTAFRVWWTKYRSQIDLVAVNTSGSMDLAGWIHLLKYDSNYGVWDQPMKIEVIQTAKEASDENPILGYLKIGDQKITFTAQKDPAKIPWQKLGVETVIESTGKFLTPEKAGAHLSAGAKKIVISAPPKDETIPTNIIGINAVAEAEIISNASCTTNCAAPVIQVIHQALGIEKALMTTIHAYTDDQNLQDNSHRDLRRARSAAINIVPTSTGAAISTTQLIPDLKNRFDGLAVRVPVSVGSLCDLVLVTQKSTSIEEVNQILVEASQTENWQGVLAVTQDEIVSSDIKGRSESSIVDLKLTNVVGGNLVKIIAWYDNEFGYCHRLIEQAIKIS